MFRLVTSNDTARLADQLADQLAASRDNPLVPARVLVPQAGLKRWLQVHLAERSGVLANADFILPAQFAWELLRAARPDFPERSPFEVAVLRWHLYTLLLDVPPEGAALLPLREYLAGDGDRLRCCALSLELARVYERMQGYRREKLLAWERGGDAGNWQAELWRRLLPRVGGASRAARVDDWLRRFDPEYVRGEYTDKPAPPGLPARFACFACANVSPDVLRMLAVAGRHCDVDFYLPLPSKEYLGDTPTRRRAVRGWLQEKRGGNELIVSQGGALAEFVELLYGYEYVQPDDEIEFFDAAIDRRNLLGRVRDDILKHAAPGDDPHEALPDASLQFHACHTPLREVQTLHDALLAMFEADGTLQPRDIAVMMPDVAAYAPAIEAVFGGIDRADPRWAPFNLGDAGAAALHPAAQLFLDLLDAPASRWEVDELLEVLAVPGVMRRFDLDAEAVERLSRRVRDAGVRWGEDEHARADCGGYREFSWAFGIERMLAGFACGDAADILVGGTAPLAGVEGATFANLDAVLAVTEAWRHLREQSRHPRTAPRWQAFLNETLDSLYRHDPRDSAETRALERIRGALAALAHDCEAADPALELAWADVRTFLRETLANPDPHQYLFTGGITFCGMVPLRVVPFRVICLLGMNEDAFPRRARGGLDPLLADRRAGHPETGDRDVRSDDRLLFLQLLATARGVFYVSWVGRDAHSNETLAPSVVVAELMDVLRDGYLGRPDDDEIRDAQDALLPCVQPLHPFDARRFDAEAPLSYAREWLAAASSAASPGTAAAIAPFAPDAPLPSRELPGAGALTLDALCEFLLDPARGFLEQGLDLVLPRPQRGDADDEPLSPHDGLTCWKLTRALLDFGQAGASASRDLLRARGQLPPGALGDEALREAQGRADALRAAVLAFTEGAALLAPENLQVAWHDAVQLQGAPADRYPNGVLHVRAGEIDGRHVLRAWLDALLCAAAGVDRPVLLVGLEGNDARAFTLPRLEREPARRQLRSLIDFHRRGRRVPMPFFVRTSWDHALACAKAEHKPGAATTSIDIGVFERAAQQAADESGFGSPGELDSDAVKVAWRGRQLPGAADGELARALHLTALAVFAPVAQAWTEPRA
jgi:exodeoxyribonuclease V gamma subunit